MHGRKKQNVVKPTEEEAQQQREQVRTARAIFGQILSDRRAEVYSLQILEKTAKALAFHPEFPTLWGYRRELLNSDICSANRRELLQQEFGLLEKALRRSQKVYSIWFHRRWTLERLFEAARSKEEARKLLDVELELCSKLLDADERNFHCWNHRAHAMALMRRALSGDPAGRPDATVAGSVEADDSKESSSAVAAVNTAEAQAAVEDAISAIAENSNADEPAVDLLQMDLDLSKSLINRNFSNYSAWHLRALLQEESRENEDDPSGVDRIALAEELEWVQQGIYTEPNDQSVWLYHHWLTLLDSRASEPRITHCAICDKNLLVFFSREVCVQGPAIVTRLSADGARQEVTPGMMSSMIHETGDKVAVLRTRALPSSRRRRAIPWRFSPEGRSSFGLEGEAAISRLEITVAVEVLGSFADGRPSRSHLDLRFDGSPVVCGQPSKGPSPATVAITGHEVDANRKEVLLGELSRIAELLELEPDCKWALLSKGRLASASAAGGSVEDRRSVEEACLQGYKRMCELDPLRAGFYEEAQAATIARVSLLGWLAQGGNPSISLDWTALKLRHLPPPLAAAGMGLQILDISDNLLATLGPLLWLQTLEELRVARNRLSTDVTEAFVLPHLSFLDVSGNLLQLGGGSALSKPPPPPQSLREVILTGNPDIMKLCNEKSSVDLLALLLAGTEQTAGWQVDTVDSTCVCRRD
mmetsp:Transcript_31123/g.68786  ORF Transcript_31123/g.68786 Transcript_31123/m.68786 type:complete len:703 (+) Transcript_31123:51-2159(+)